MNKLSVRLHGIPVGFLERNEEGKLYFAYLKDTKIPISHSMPLKEKAFDHKSCKAYFGGLIPYKQGYIKGRDIFSSLMEFGRDCIGAISFHDLSTPIILDNDIAFKTTMKESSHSLLPGEREQKAICFVKNNILFPEEGAFSTHIMKTEQNEEMIYNNYFCLKIARHAGLPVPDFFLKDYANRPVLIIKRIDRVIENHYVKRLHQENCCQSLGVCGDQKYEHDKEVGFSQLFNLLRVTRVPAYAKNYLVKVVMLNVAINCTEAYAKNFSLVSKSLNSWELSPFFQFYCNDDETIPLPMVIGQARHAKAIQEKDWKIFCEQINYTYPIFKVMKKEYNKKLKNAISQAEKDFKKEGIKIDKKWIDFIDVG